MDREAKAPSNLMTNTQTNPTNPFESIDRLSKSIARICRHARILLLGRAIFLSIGFLLLLLIGVSAIDFLLRLPSIIRWLVLLGIIYAAIRCSITLILPAWKIGLTKSAIALRIEHQSPSLKGLLTTSIDLIDANQSTHQPPNKTTESHIESALTSATIAIANRRLRSIKPPAIIAWNQITYALGLFIFAAIILSTLWIQTPELVSIGTKRTLTPWTNAHWPKHFPIIDSTKLTIHPIDITIPIQATVNITGNANPIDARASIRWRILNKHNQPIINWQTQPMIAQQHRLDTQDGTILFERLIERPTIPTSPSPTPDNITLEYFISTRDDQTQTHTISLIDPPKLMSMSAYIQLPQYAQSIADRQDPASGMHLFDTSDNSLSPILTGSEFTLTLLFSKPIQSNSQNLPAWITSLIESNALSADTTLEHPEPNTLILRSTVLQTMTIEPIIKDLTEIAVRDSIRLHLGVIDDLDPEAGIIEPASDEKVSPQATIEITAEFIDDLGLKSISLNAKITNTDQSNPWITLDNQPHSAAMRATLTHHLSIAMLKAKPGSTIEIIARANDLRATNDTASIGISESRIRMLHVVSKDEIIDSIRAELGPITRILRRLDQSQTHIQGQLQKQPHLDSASQHQLTDQLDRLSQSFKELDTTLTRNAIADQALRSLITQANATSTQAAQTSSLAAKQIEQGTQARALENQSKVRDQLGQLLTLLDRGQDSWLAIRSVEKLRDNLIALNEQTNTQAAKSAGQSLDQLDDQQRTALEQIVKKQIDAASDANETLATLDKTAANLQENDPAQAQALQDAAERGRRSEIQDKLNQAAEQIANNQTSSASSLQSDVIEELNEMLEELQHAINDRDNQLRRELASIMDSIKQLITQQTIEIKTAQTLTPQNTTAAIDSMIRLVGNTLAVRDDATGAYPETQIIADKLVLASASQQLAIKSLRQTPIQLPQAIAAERASLHHLEQALLLTEQLDAQAADRQAQEQRTKLRDAYRESLESQIIIRNQTNLLGLDQLNRRQRRDARTLATNQKELGDNLASLFDQSTDLAEAPMFALAHSQLESQIAKSANGLAQRSINNPTRRAQQATIDILAMLVEALDDGQQQSTEDFEDGSQGGSGDGSGSGSGNEPVIPPVAQLKLLRAMQQLAATQTKHYADNPNTIPQEDLQSLSDLQTQLFKHGQLLIEQLNNSPTERNTE